MERLERLIAIVRAKTHTEDYSETEGISDETLVEYFNDAQKALRVLMNRANANLHITTSLINAVASQEEYSLPIDSLTGYDILNVEYKLDSTTWLPLLRRTIKERDASSSGTPTYYIQAGKKLWLHPTPGSSTTGGIRVTYGPKMRDLDIRRGLISAVDTPVTTITCDLNPTKHKDADIPHAGETLLIDVDYVTVVDSAGTICAAEIPIESYNSGTGIISVSASYTLPEGSTIVAGNYVLAGPYSSNFIDFPDMCKAYIMSYVQAEIYKNIGHQDLQIAINELSEQAAIISALFSKVNNDLIPIPIVDNEYRLI